MTTATATVYIPIATAFAVADIAAICYRRSVPATGALYILCYSDCCSGYSSTFIN